MAAAIRVLYVDDEADLLDIGKLFLEESGDFTVTTAMSAPEGIRLLEQEKFDAIISDYQMPDMDGIQFLVEVRSRFGSIPFILFTGRGREEVVIQAINSGADFYLQKGGEPGAQFAELTHKIKAAAFRNRAEDSLRKSEEKYRQLIELSNEVILVAQDGMLKLVNHRLIELLGYSEQELLSTPFPVFIHPDDRAMVVERYQKRLKCEEFPSRYSFRLNPKDGNTLWLEISAVVIDWDGRPATLNFLTDITERKRAEEALLESNDRSNGILASLDDAIFLVDPSTRLISMCNNATTRIFGYSHEELVGKQTNFLHVDHEHFEQFGRDAITAYEDPGYYATEFEMQRKDGSVFPSEHFVRPIRYPDGRINYVVSVVRDITERKRAEEALRESEEKYRNIFTAENDAVLLVDVKTGFILEANNSACRMFGYSFEEFARLKNTDLSAEPEKTERAMKETQTWIPLRYQKKKDGTIFPVEISISWFVLNDRYLHIAAIHDITERKRAEEKLKASEEKYRTYIDNSPEGIFIVDAEGNYRDINPSACSMLGYTREEFLSLTISDLVHPDDLTSSTSRFSSLQETGLLMSESVLIKKDGDLLPVILNAARLPDGRYLGFCSDITERKTAETALSESEAFLRQVIAGANEGIIVYDRELRITLWNPFMEKMTGLKAEDVQGKFAVNIFPFIREKGIENLMKQALSGVISESTDFEYIISSTGKNGWVKGIYSPHYDSHQNIAGVIGIVRDITRHKQAEEALRESEEKYRGIFDESITAVYVFDNNKNFINTNQAGLDFLGYSREELLHMSIPDVDADPAVVLPAHQELLSGGRLINYEHRLRRKDGTVITVLNNSRPLMDNHGNVVGMLSTLIDITGRKLVEETLKKNQIQFADAMDLAHMVNWEFDATTGIFTFDDRFYAFYGTTAELEGGNQMPADVYAKKFVHPDDQHLVAVEVNKAIQATDPGFMSQVEHRIIRRDGEIRNIVVRFGITKDENGRTIKTHGANQDITDRKRVEEALQHLTEFQESIITNARVWLSVLDAKGKILVWNTAAEEISGYRSEEVIGYKDIWKKIYPDKEYRKQITDTINRIIRDKNYLENFETTILSKGGTKKVISWNTRGIPNATGNVFDYIAIGMDVTDRIRAEDLRHESERRMTDIISFLPDATLVIDKNGIVLAWNRAMEEMTGVPAVDIIGKGNYEYAIPFYHERRPITVDLVLHDDPAVVAKYPVMQTEGKSRNAEIFIPHLNKGRGAHLWFTASPLYDGDGNLTGAIESIRDITERKQVEEAIQKNKETYRELVESISDVIFEIDCEGKITYISPVVQKVLEFEPEEMIGKNFIEFIYPDDRNLLNRRFSDLSDGTEPPTDYRVTTKSGNVRWVRTQTKPVMIEKTFCGARGTLIDITLRKVAEEAFRESKALTDAVVENVPLMIFLKEATDLRFVIFNKAGEELLGYDRKALLGKNNLDLFPPEQADYFMAKDREVLDGEAGMLDIPEESILTAKKGLRLLHTRKVCIRGGDGTTKFLLGISEDITERKELEKETENHTQELLKFSSSLAAANKKLNLLSSITRHDINNQMTVLMGYLTIIKKKQPDPAFNEYFVKVSNAAQRISSMIRFTKEYESIGVAAPVWQDCRIVVDTAAKETPLGQIIVNVDLPAGGEIFADPLIVKVFYNLMDNAVRYGGKITTIRFSVEEHDGDQIIVCEDDGDGVVAEEKEKIFERGFGKNTGMGLFLSREILSITGITIKEAGEPGKGARFEMTVPKGAWRFGRSNENKE